MRPPTIQAAKTRAAEPTARAISLLTRNTPVPMVSPITMATADQRPKPRTKPDGPVRARGLAPLAFMEGGESLLSRCKPVKPLFTTETQRHGENQGQKGQG